MKRILCLLLIILFSFNYLVAQQSKSTDQKDTNFKRKMPERIYHKYYDDLVIFPEKNEKLFFNSFKAESIPSVNVVLNKLSSVEKEGHKTLVIRPFYMFDKKPANAYAMIQEANGEIIAKYNVNEEEILSFKLDSLKFPLKLIIGNMEVDFIEFILDEKKNYDISLFFEKSGAMRIGSYNHSYKESLISNTSKK